MFEIEELIDRRDARNKFGWTRKLSSSKSK
jgi:hypothetical protein